MEPVNKRDDHRRDLAALAGIIAPPHRHINMHEAGIAELLGGHKILDVLTKDLKINAGRCRADLFSVEGMARATYDRPALVYISAHRIWNSAVGP